MSKERLIAEVHMAKPLLEHEEGMNHLWVRFAPLSGAANVRVSLLLPAGIYWDGDAGENDVDSTNCIILADPAEGRDLLLAIYTSEPVACGDSILELEITVKDNSGFLSCESIAIPLRIVDAAQVDAMELEMDEEVVQRVKAHAAAKANKTLGTEQEVLECTPAKIIRYDARYRSKLEQDLWIEG